MTDLFANPGLASDESKPDELKQPKKSLSLPLPAATTLAGSESSPTPHLMPPPTASAKPAVTMRRFDDYDAVRDGVYTKMLSTASSLPPVVNKTHSLSLENVRYVDPPQISKRKRKEAILTGQTLARRMRGEWVLRDLEGNELDRQDKVVMKVPSLTSDGTFVHNGSEYALLNQQRLRAGIFSRQKENGENESFVNVIEGGPTHRYSLDPKSELFYLHLDQAKIPLLPLLESLGATDKELKSAFGEELFNANKRKSDGVALRKLAQKLLPNSEDLSGDALRAAITQKFSQMKIDPDVSHRTLGARYDHLNKDSVLAAAKKLLAINRGEADYDDRDELANQTFHGVEDIFSERIAKDRAGVRRQLLYKAMLKNNLSSLPSSALQKQLDSALIESGLGFNLEQINASEILDKAAQITRTGEGGMSRDASPASARNVQSSQLGFIDLVKTPESSAAGLAVHLGSNVQKGDDGNIYAQFRDPRTGQDHWLTPSQLRPLTIGFSTFNRNNDEDVVAMRNGRMEYVKRDEVDYHLPKADDMFGHMSNLVPLISETKGHRVSMAGRMFTQALPLVGAEAPLVQSAVGGTDRTESYESRFGTKMGAIRAKQGGVVQSLEDGVIKVKYDDGSTDEIELHQNMPLNRKTSIHQTAMVEPGQRFNPTDLLARSNFTDEKGATALGLNARVAFLPWDHNFEDAIVISESMAKRLTSSHMYQKAVEPTPSMKISKREFMQHYAGKYPKAVLDKIGDNGAVKVGEEVRYGEPIILAVDTRSTAKGKVHRKKQSAVSDQTILWEKKEPGIVTDVIESKKGPVVVVKASRQMQVADKLANRYGGKGVVGKILPDDEMPQGADGKPFELLLNPLGVISRLNPAQKAELAYGKVAAATGKPIIVDGFESGDMMENARRALSDNGLKLEEDVIDPRTGRKIKGTPTGHAFFMKLHHQAEDKGSARSGGLYTQDGEPAKGSKGQAKRLALLDTNALLSHGATAVIRDGKLVRGQQNEDYWMQFMNGYSPRTPTVPKVYTKMVNELKAGGINVVRKGEATQIMALTNSDVKELAGDRRIRTGDTVNFDKDLVSVPGGLFDEKIFGDRNNGRWAAIDLPVPIPNPVMEEPIRRLLGLTQKEFESTLAGDHAIEGFGSGPLAMKKALEAINVDKEVMKARVAIAGTSKTKRDDAVRRLGYLKGLQKTGLKPAEYMLDAVPVLPPQFRPVSVMGEKQMPLVADANLLYRELIDVVNNYKELKDQLGDEGLGDETSAIYNAFKGVTGLASPLTQKNQERNVKGILKRMLGSSPKHGTFQRKLIGTTIDNVGRGVITPNPDYDMDTIGIPEKQAFEAYNRFIVRRLKRRGMSLSAAMGEVESKTPLARKMLQEEMEERPVIMNRAPVLHRFGIMAFRPQLVKSNSVQVSPLIVKGFGADFDGNCCGFFTEVCLKINLSAVRLFDPMGSFVAALEEASGMSLSDGQELAAESDDVIICMNIGDFPRLGEPETNKYGQLVYNVPGGVQIQSYDHSGNAVGWYDVTGFTVDADHTAVKVLTDSNREVVVSDNESLAVFCHDTGDVIKEAPAARANQWMPVIKRHHYFGDQYDKQVGRQHAESTTDLWARNSAKLLSYGSRDCLIGVLSGLLDGICVVGVDYSSPGGRPQLSCRINTNSTYLVRGVLQLLQRLGIRWSKTKAPLDGDSEASWVISLDLNDLLEYVDELNCGKDKTNAWLQLLRDRGPNQDEADVVPITRTEHEELSKHVKASDEGHSEVSVAFSREGMEALPRQLLSAVLTLVPARELLSLRNRVANVAVHWDRVKSVIQEPVQDVFDLEVPDTKVFAVNHGLVIYDTVNWQIPTMPEAVSEAYDKMLPSRQLITPRDFKSPMHMPSQEFVAGLFEGTRRKSDRREHVFKTKRDAILAYKRGDVLADDNIKILEE